MTVGSWPFTSRWRPVVEIGIGDTRTPVGTGVWGISVWDAVDATWNGADPIWRDVSCFAQTVSTDTGRDFSVDRFTPGTAQVQLLNTDGWATDESDPAATLRPGRHIRIAVFDTATATTMPVWRGFIDAVDPSFNPEEGDTVTVRAHDSLGELGLWQRPAPLPVTGAGDSGDARFRRLTTMAGWPGPWIGDVDSSPVTMAGRLFDQPFSEELGITADSEGGAIFAAPDGRLVFRNRDWQTWPADAGTVWLIGNSGEPGEVCPSGFEVANDRAEFANQITYAREAAGAVAVTVSDTESQAKYGVLPLPRSDLICNDDGQVAVLARRALRVKAPGGERVRAVTLSARTDPTGIIPMLLAADVTVSPPIRAQLTLVRGGTEPIDDLGILQRVSHELTPDDWTCRLGFDRALPYVRAVARWDSGTWGLDAWTGPPVTVEV